MVGDRIVVAVVLVALGAGLFYVSQRLFQESVEGGSSNSTYAGSISVAASDPNAEVTASVGLSSDPNRPYGPTDSPLSMEIRIRTEKPGLEFALVLEGLWVRTSSSQRTIPIPPAPRRQAGTVWVGGDAVTDVWLVKQAGVPAGFGNQPPPSSAVIVGRSTDGSDGSIDLLLGIPTDGSYLAATATGYEFYLPALLQPWDGGTEGSLLYRRDGDGVPDEAADLLEGTDWWSPELFDSRVTLDVRIDDKIDAIPPPSAIARNSRIWTSRTGTPQVSGVLVRAEALQESQTRQFRAGAFVGLGGALLVWGAEILLEELLGWRRRRRSVPAREAEADGSG